MKGKTIYCVDGTKWYDKASADFLKDWIKTRDDAFNKLYDAYGDRVKKIFDEIIRTKELAGKD